MRLARIDTSLLASAVVFFPMWLKGFEFNESLAFAAPILTSSMSAFVLNDIYDVEKDKVNHPSRALPMGKISLNAAMIIYFALLFATLVLIKALIPTEKLFLYLVFLLIVTNYNHVVERFPRVKNLYVALSVIVPVLVAQQIVNGRQSEIALIASLLLFVIGREMLMDIIDFEGDGHTFVKLIGVTIGTGLAFLLQAISLFALLTIANNTWEWVALIVVALLFASGIWLWQTSSNQRMVIQIMKIQLAASIVFLVS